LIIVHNLVSLLTNEITVVDASLFQLGIISAVVTHRSHAHQTGDVGRRSRLVVRVPTTPPAPRRAGGGRWLLLWHLLLLLLLLLLLYGTELSCGRGSGGGGG